MIELRTAHTADLDTEDAELIGQASVVQRRMLHGGRALRTADHDGWIYVLPVSAPVDVSGELVCDWRPGSVW